MGQNSDLGSLKVAAILVMAALALSLAAFAPVQQSFAANGKAAKAQTWRGQIANVQLDSSGEPDWIQSGTWLIKKTAAPVPGNPNLTFVSQITMVNADGTSIHKHRISNFAATSYEVGKDAVSLQGNATITMKDGPVKNVPVQVKISGRSLAISLDKNMVDSHFGASPIYGVVSKVPSPITPQSYSGLSVSDSVTSSKKANSNHNSTSNSNSTSISTGPATSSNSTLAEPATNSTSTSSSPPSSSTPTITPSSNSTSSAPAQSSPAANTTISLAAKSATDLYSWFSGSDENPTLRLAANSNVTIGISNETDRKHKLVIQSEDGTQQLAASKDILVGQSGDLTYRPTAPGTLQYMCYYHSPMRGTIEVS